MNNISNKNFGWVERAGGSLHGAAIGNAIGGKKGRALGSALGGAIAGMFDDYLVLFLDKDKKADCEIVKTTSEGKACDTVRTNNPGSNYKAFVYPSEYRQISKYIGILNKDSKGISPRLQLYLNEVEDLMNPKPLSDEAKIILGILGGAAIVAVLYAGSRLFSKQELIVEKAFSGAWISEGELRMFAEDYQKEFGQLRRESALTLGSFGSMLGGAMGMAGGVPGVLVGAGLGGALGARLGAGFTPHLVLFMNDKKEIVSKSVKAISKKSAVEKVKKDNPRGSDFVGFEQSEEEEKAIDLYMYNLVKKYNCKKMWIDDIPQLIDRKDIIARYE